MDGGRERPGRPGVRGTAMPLATRARRAPTPQPAAGAR